jgi:hypothetical protein
VGRFVLVPESPTTGVGFSPTDRAEAISMMVGLGRVIAAAMLSERSDAGPVAIARPPDGDAPVANEKASSDHPGN